MTAIALRLKSFSLLNSFRNIFSFAYVPMRKAVALKKSTARLKRKRTSVLKTSDLSIAVAFANNKLPRQIASEFNISLRTVYRRINKIKKLTRTADQKQLKIYLNNWFAV